MTDHAELKRLAEALLASDDHADFPGWMAASDAFDNATGPAAVMALIAENERLAASVKLNLCDYPAIHRGDVDLLISFVSGTSQIELAELHQCTPPNISRKIRRVKERLGWKAAMGPLEICARADQLRALASQGAVVTADLMAERDQLKAENERLRKIVSDGATSCGAAVSVECSLDFMGHLPVEIFSVISKLRNALAECSDSLHGEMLQKFGSQLPDDMHPVTRREYERDMAEVAAYRAAMGKGEQS